MYYRRKCGEDVKMSKQKILFICSANVNRSKTAELIFKQEFDTKSAGFYCEDSDKTNKMNSDLANWADIIFVFERDHILRMKALFPTFYGFK